MTVRTSDCKRKKNYVALKEIIIARHHTPTSRVACDLSHVYSLWISRRSVQLSHALLFHMLKPDKSTITFEISDCTCMVTKTGFRGGCNTRLKHILSPEAVLLAGKLSLPPLAFPGCLSNAKCHTIEIYSYWAHC